MDQAIPATPRREPWNKGKLVGQKAPLKVKDIWAIRVRLQLYDRTPELALFNLGIDSKLRACDLVALRVRDVSHGGRMSARAIIMQQKTQRPVQFEITEVTRDAVAAWIRRAALTSDVFLFPSRVHASPHLSTRQYARILDSWVREIGLDAAGYGTHSMRRTKASPIIGGPRIFGQFNYCLVTPSWRARSVILVLKWMTLLDGRTDRGVRLDASATRSTVADRAKTGQSMMTAESGRFRNGGELRDI